MLLVMGLYSVGYQLFRQRIRGKVEWIHTQEVSMLFLELALAFKTEAVFKKVEKLVNWLLLLCKIGSFYSHKVV